MVRLGVILSLLLALRATGQDRPDRAKHPALTASIAENGVAVVELESSVEFPREGKAGAVITNSTTNRGRNNLLYQGLPGDEGAAPASTLHDGKPRPSTVTRTYNTFRPVVEKVAGQAFLIADVRDAESANITAAYWVPKAAPVRAKPGQTLFGKLIGPDKNVMAVCTCTVEEPAKGHFVYAFKAENRTKADVRLRWGSHDAAVKAGDEFSQSVESTECFMEQTASATVVLPNGPRYTFPANVWAAP